MVTMDKIQKWIIIILIVLLGGTTVANSYYKKKAIKAAIAETVRESEKAELKYVQIIAKNNIDIIRLEKLNIAYKADIEKIVEAIRKKAGEIAELKKEYVALKKRAPKRADIAKEVENASTKDLSDEFNAMGYSNTISSY